MKSVFWLVPDSIAGRSGPQRDPWSLSELRAGGFDAILNLSQYEPDAAAFESAGLASAWVPLPTDVPATAESAEKCVADLPRAYVFFRDQLAARRRVLVHCWAGQDRTGLLLALHVAHRDGLSAPEAIAQVRTVRPLALTTAGWEALALAVIPRVLEKLPAST